MAYLVAQCPMIGCNNTCVVCSLPCGAKLEFDPDVYVGVKCANCGVVFRELAARLEVAQNTPATAGSSHESA